MKNLVLIIIALFVAAIQLFAKKVEVDFFNTHKATCAVYLDEEYLGRMKAGENIQMKLKKGNHTLSFVVFDETGNYYTYVRDLNINETNNTFMLLTNDTGYVHIEKYEGVSPLVLNAMAHLPILTDAMLDKKLLTLTSSTFELNSFNVLTSLISQYRITTQQLTIMTNYLTNTTLKATLVHQAYQHVIDKHNYHHALLGLDEASVKRIENHTSIVNKYI